jgi:hypothetical protein
VVQDEPQHPLGPALRAGELERAGVAVERDDFDVRARGGQRDGQRAGPRPEVEDATTPWNAREHGVAQPGPPRASRMVSATLRS